VSYDIIFLEKNETFFDFFDATIVKENILYKIFKNRYTILQKTVFCMINQVKLNSAFRPIIIAKIKIDKIKKAAIINIGYIHTIK
jgi:hypothetical protein